MILFKPFGALALSLLAAMTFLSCRLTSSQPGVERMTANTVSPSALPINDSDWEFKFVGEVPDKRASLSISCTKQGFCWVWNSRFIWAAQESGGWKQIYTIEAESNNFITNIFLLSPHIGWMAKGNGLYRTEDGAASWTQVAVPPLDNREGRIWDVHFRDRQLGWVVGGQYQVLTEVPPVNNALSDDRKRTLMSRILQTADGGATWQVQNVVSSVGRFTNIHFWNGEVGVASGDAGSLLTTDGGKQWTDIKRHIRADETGARPKVSDASFINRNDGWLLLSDSEIMVTNNGGKTWKAASGVNADPGAASRAQSLTQIAFVNRTNGIALSDKLSGAKLFKTMDGGKTWMEIVMDEKIHAISFPHTGSGFLVGDKNVYSISLKK